MSRRGALSSHSGAMWAQLPWGPSQHGGTRRGDEEGWKGLRLTPQPREHIVPALLAWVSEGGQLGDFFPDGQWGGWHCPLSGPWRGLAPRLCPPAVQGCAVRPRLWLGPSAPQGCAREMGGRRGSRAWAPRPGQARHVGAAAGMRAAVTVPVGEAHGERFPGRAGSGVGGRLGLVLPRHLTRIPVSGASCSHQIPAGE